MFLLLDPVIGKRNLFYILKLLPLKIIIIINIIIITLA